MGNTRKKLEKRSVVWGTRPVGGRSATVGPRARASRRRQRDVLCDVMLSASQCEAWLTLEELSKLTHYPPASISAQLRHLRKQEFGGYEVEKRQRLSGRILHGEDFGTVWEYRLLRGVIQDLGAGFFRTASRKRQIRTHSQEGETEYKEQDFGKQKPKTKSQNQELITDN